MRDDQDEEEAELTAESVVELPVADVLDLHSFRPRDVRDVVTTFLDEAHAAGFRAVRLIHGKGIGVQREMVRSLLARDPRVVSFEDAPGQGGGWGATIVTFGEPGRR